MSPATVDLSPPPAANLSESDFLVTWISHLRGVRWRINLCNFRSSSFDDLRRITADYRRRYAILRRRLLIDTHLSKDGSSSANLVMDNPLSENPDSMWGRFFRNAELEKMLDQDLSRLYPEHGSYFQTPGCQSMLRRILLLWCLRHPEYGYRQGMHELLAPLLYVLHTDLQRLSEARKLHEDHFTDKFDDALFQENDLAYNFDLKRTPDFVKEETGFQERTKKKVVTLDELDPEIQTILLLSDAYGAEGELGVVLSEKFMEHDVYCMFDALMSGVGGAVAMAEFFSPSTGDGSQTGIAPVIEASSALYHLLSVVDSSLYSHLVELQVEPQYFALRWFRVLFGREFSLENLLIIWDEIFSFDNAKLGTFDEVELGVLNSRRGAFISAMAASMILQLRSSLLATEIATSCLQRLLNFPGSIELHKLIGKAKSIFDLALDANVSSSTAVTGSYDQKNSSAVRGHSLSFDCASSKTPLICVPESYWEEKWRHLQKEEQKKENNALKQPSTPRRSWTEKIKLRLSWSDSERSISPSRNGGKEHRSVRRSLLQDLSRQLGEEFDNIGENDSINQNGPIHDESVGDNESLNQNGPFHNESILRVQDVHGKLGGIEKTFSGESTAIEENSTIFSDRAIPAGGSNSLEPFFSPSRNGKEHRSVRRSLLQDLSRQLGEEFDDIGENDSITHNGPFHDESTGDNESLNQNDPFHTESIVRVQDVHGKLGSIEKTFSGQSTSSEENSTIFSDPASPTTGSNSLENDSEKSSVASCVSHDNEESIHSDPFDSISEDRPNSPENKPNISEDQSTTSDLSDASVSVVSDSPDSAATAPKDKKSLSGKFQWLWKLGRHASGEGPSDKGNAQVIKSKNEESQRSTMVAQPAEEQSCSSVNVRGDVAEQNLMCTLRNLGHSMLENIQVIESVLQQDIRQAGSLDNLSKSALVEKGQVRAVSAIKELRKISNLLSEM